MVDDLSKNGLVPKPDKPARKKNRRTIRFCGAWITAPMGWNTRWIAGLIHDYGSSQWLGTGGLAYVGYGHNSISNKKKVRRYYPAIFNIIRKEYNELLVQQPGDNGETVSVKLFNPESKEEQEYLERKTFLMKEKKELTEDQYKETVALFDKKMAEIGERHIANLTTASQDFPEKGSGEEQV